MFEQLKKNILAWEQGLIPNQRAELLALLEEVYRLAATYGRIDGPDWEVVEALAKGVQAAPAKVVMHHKLHLLQVVIAHNELLKRVPAPPAEPTEVAAEAHADPTPPDEAAGSTEPPAE